MREWPAADPANDRHRSRAESTGSAGMPPSPRQCSGGRETSPRGIDVPFDFFIMPGTAESFKARRDDARLDPAGFSS